VKKKSLSVLRQFASWVIPRSIMYLFLRVVSSNNTFSGRVRYRLAFDRRPILTTFVDKIASRDFCRQRTQGIKIPKVFQTVQSEDELDQNLWPEEYVIKPSHGSGAVLFVTRKAKRGLSYSLGTGRFRWDQGYKGVLSEDLDLEKIRNLVGKWLTASFEYSTFKFPEWAYRGVPRRVIVEELVRNSDGSSPFELRLHCFHGEVALIRVTDVIEKGAASTFNRSGEQIDARLANEPKSERVPQTLPPFWRDAVREAELLSAGIDYLRVDLFLTDRGVHFSELTPYPNGGLIDFAPKEVSMWLADLWEARKSDL
jgi:hypothetical protein